MAPLHRLDIHGPTLAVLLQSVLTSERACDGVLLGSAVTTTSVQAEDTLDAVAVEERTALVSCTLACAATGSFYDGAGAIDAAKLDALCRSAGSGELLGWFSYRPGTLEQPSTREAAVTAALQCHLASSSGGGSGAGTSGGGGGGGSSSGIWARSASLRHANQQQQRAAPAAAAGAADRAAVFLLLSSGEGHGGATLHLTYRAFQLPGAAAAEAAALGGACLEPLEVRVLNLGRVLSAAHGCAPFEAPALAAALAAGPLPSAVERRLRDAAGGGGGDAAEAVCGALLSELRELADKVGVGSAALAAARERNARLLQRIGEVSGANS
ncbi:hypothetical protein Rsub_03381 [Raphidocelis subcapitata]|uniref:MPN domain-containing protein n=1 Tax=Raphidocelis subcapitata TaxID=307507 RepID=A0A2V0NRF0_9CHLO|nr:hypothetical protein Rsub_03381 [Raphidocelis subcapitata]|eukprot:GBF90248.1 hypothetical protein Rsub_03381 [Raphidocelis subcapitata]